MESANANETTSVTTVCRSGEICETVVDAVAEATNTDPLDLEPLYTTVDPDALDRLFASSNRARSPPLEVRLEIANCEVTISGDGRVVATPSMDSDVGAPVVQPAD